MPERKPTVDAAVLKQVKLVEGQAANPRNGKSLRELVDALFARVGLDAYGPVVLAVMGLTAKSAWWVNVLNVIEDLPVPDSVAEKDVVAILRGAPTASSVTFAIRVAEEVGRRRGVSSAMAKAAANRRFVADAAIYSKTWSLRARALAEQRVHQPKKATSTNKETELSLGELRFSLPPGCHTIYANGKAQPGLRVWCQELDESFEKEHLVRWTKQVLQSLVRGAPKSSCAVLALGKAIVILLNTETEPSKQHLHEAVLGLRASDSGAETFGHRTATVVGGLAYGGEDVGFDDGKVVTCGSLTFGVMANDTADVQPLLECLLTTVTEAP